MEPGSLSVTRTLPIDGALLGDVLLRLRRDGTGAVLRWTLGDRGAVGVDVNFTSDGPRWCATGRIWNPAGLALAAVTLSLEAIGEDAVQLTLEPGPALPPWWEARMAALTDLSHAVVDELSEELLWHAARAGVAPGGH